MTIDTRTVGSPGWWMQKGATRIREQYSRLDDLIRRANGDARLPEGTNPAMSDAYCAFQSKARANWADTIVRARDERIKLNGFSTAADADADGDSVAQAMAKRARLYAELPDAVWFALVCASGPMMIGRKDDRTVVTAEDPRQVAIFRDPATNDIRAAIKVMSDQDIGKQYAYLMLDATEPDGPKSLWLHVASRETRSRSFPVFSSAWDWDREPELLDLDRLPITELTSRRGVGVFELHTDLLDKINLQTLQGLVIAAMQAYKQRALVNLPDVDDDGNTIDWSGILTAGPGAVWNLPEGVELKEFSEADVRGILEMSKDSRRELSDLTSTPLRASVADSANQTAEGAQYAREQLVFSIEDFLGLNDEPVADAMALIAQWEGDDSRSDPSLIVPRWADPTRRSLAEMGDVDSKAQNTLPLKERLVKIWGYSPSEADRVAAEKRAEQMESQALGFIASNGSA